LGRKNCNAEPREQYVPVKKHRDKKKRKGFRKGSKQEKRNKD